MDLKHPTTKIQDHESDQTQTPPHSPTNQLVLPFTNGKPNHHLLAPTPLQSTIATVQVQHAYKECLKNHAAAIGGHALDGCGEYMPSPSFTPTEPSSYKCSACGCHRNFHRREPTAIIPARTHFIDFHKPHQTLQTSTPPSPPSPPPYQPTNYPYGQHGQHLVLSLSTAADQNQNINQNQNQMVVRPGTPVAMKISGRKRFRTKFSQDQKDKMLSFAEKVGWKMQRCDDKMLVDFCNEIGIRRGVFKVWMHNNKNTLAKRENTMTTTTTTTTTTLATSVTTNTDVAACLARSNESSHQTQDHGSSSSS